MLYVLGAVVADTVPFNVDAVSRSARADLVAKNVMGGLDKLELMGEGEDQLEFSGQLLPYRTGGLTQFEVLDQMRRSGARFPVMRGDGKRLGVYAITELSEEHEELMRDGVGFTVEFSITCRKVPDVVAATPGGIDGAAIIMGLVSLFGALR